MSEPTEAYSGHKAMVGALDTEPITDNVNTHTCCKAVYIGVAGNYDFYIHDQWEPHLGCLAGTVIPVRATGARDNPGGGAPSAGAIVFYY